MFPVFQFNGLQSQSNLAILCQRSTLHYYCVNMECTPLFLRTIVTPENHSFFLFGARGTGKSHLLRQRFPNAFTIDLLNPEVEQEYSMNPGKLVSIVEGLSDHVTHVVIDEVQKNSKLLDLVHFLMESRNSKKHFVLSGSSARKLKAGGANLLAGRAFVRNLFPLTFSELKESFDQFTVLAYGSLPKISIYSNTADRVDFLQAYCQVYLREEIWNEQIIRSLPPFRKFLEIAATDSGKILNYAKIARDVGVDPKTVQSYFGILEDTLIGFHLEPFHNSVRKRQRAAPKFYFFDNGVSRALANMLAVIPKEGTSYFGDLFEQMVMNEIHRENLYRKSDFKFYFLQTASGVEVDLVVERPGKSVVLVEIKSTSSIKDEDTKNLKHFAADFPNAEMFLFSRDKSTQRFDRILAMEWKLGIQKLFTLE